MKLFTFEDAVGISYAANGKICLVHDYRADFETTHIHDYYELVYIYDGASNHDVNGNTFPLKTGSLLLIKPGSTHSFFPTIQHRAVNICFTDIPELRDILSHIGSPMAVLDQPTYIRAESLIYLLEEELKNDNDFAKTNAVNCVLWLLSIFAQNMSGNTISAASWGTLLTYIAGHYATITLSEAAEVMNISVSHFCRIFKRDFSTSFYQYLTTYRIHQAKVLLSSTNLTVNQVADAVGYENGYTHFYRAFQSREHLTPYEFKKNWKKIRSEAEHQPYVTRPGMEQLTDPGAFDDAQKGGKNNVYNTF